jgi:hypothetical protein
VVPATSIDRVLQEPVVGGGAVLGDALTEVGERACADHGFSLIR